MIEANLVIKIGDNPSELPFVPFTEKNDTELFELGDSRLFVLIEPVDGVKAIAIIKIIKLIITIIFV